MKKINAFDAWQLIKNKEFEKAVDVYSELYLISGDKNHINNKIIALMNLKNYKDAIHEHKKIIVLGENKSMLRLGVCYWCLNSYEKASELWELETKAKYFKFGGVLPYSLLLYKAVRLDQKELIIKYMTDLENLDFQPDSWPSLIVKTLLEGDDNYKLVDFVNKQSEILKNRFLTYVYFYYALRDYMIGNNEEYKKNMIKAVNLPYGFMENVFYLANWEVDNKFQIIKNFD